MIGCGYCKREGIDRPRQVHVYLGQPGAGQAYGGGFPMCWDHYNARITGILNNMLADDGFEVSAFTCDAEGKKRREHFRVQRRAGAAPES